MLNSHTVSKKKPVSVARLAGQTRAAPMSPLERAEAMVPRFYFLYYAVRYSNSSYHMMWRWRHLYGLVRPAIGLPIARKRNWGK